MKIGKRKNRGKRSEAQAGRPGEVVVRPVRPPARGWPGRGGGAATWVQQADEWRGTTVQVCGLWPFAIGASTPMAGVPLGRHLDTGATICCDPISWFKPANLIGNPSLFALGLPGLGKSTTIRRMVTGLAGFGVQPFVLGDLRPDYVDLIRALGGQVIELGRGRGFLNVLDPGEATQAAARLRAAGYDREAAQVLADAHGRQHTMVCALIALVRGGPPTDREDTILDRALKHLAAGHPGVPVLADLLKVVRDGPDEVRAVALDRGDFARYQEITEDLEASLIALAGGGKLGAMFSKPTSEPMKRDRPVVFDVSAIDDTQTDLQAAALLACWSAGFGTITVAHALADAGLEPQRHYFVVLDELWRALRAGAGMVDRVDYLTRLNRRGGVGMAMISHTMSDLAALPHPEDRAKARGFVERAGMVLCGGLPHAEMPQLTAAIPLSQAEQDLLVSWQDPPTWDPVAGQDTTPPGRGKFLIKVGGRVGIPVRVDLVPAELAINDTNKRWHHRSRTGTSDTTSNTGAPT